MINNWNQNTLTLHVRITKKCNADCSYCSSYENEDIEQGEISNYVAAAEFINSLIKKYKLGGNKECLTIQYVGGEILTVPTTYLKKITEVLEENIGCQFQHFKHGVQSNLIASNKKVISLVHIFDKNIGTSVDNFTNQRTVNGSSDNYRKIFKSNHKLLKQYLGKKPSSIVVINEESFKYIQEECKIANKEKHDLTLRPVFEGGLAKTHVIEESLANLYINIFEEWFMNYSVSIEPFTSLTYKRLLNKSNKTLDLPLVSGCPFQHNCGFSSLNLEPNGDLFVCLDMADSKLHKLGNAFKKEINEELLIKIQNRSNNLNSNCYSCDYFNECQGGCMNEAILHSGNIYGKTHYCFVWKSLFKLIDQKINDLGIEEIENWIKHII